MGVLVTEPIPPLPEVVRSRLPPGYPSEAATAPSWPAQPVSHHQTLDRLANSEPADVRPQIGAGALLLPLGGPVGSVGVSWGWLCPLEVGRDRTTSVGVSRGHWRIQRIIGGSVLAGDPSYIPIFNIFHGFRPIYFEITEFLYIFILCLFFIFI